MEFERGGQQQSLNFVKEHAIPARIENVSIIDDGEGFTKRNFDSFQKSDTTFKYTRGGKGLGRMVWLKAFERTVVTSNYMEDGSWWRRRFVFAPEDPGIHELSLAPVEPGKFDTRICLINMNRELFKLFPVKLSTIASHIVEHLFPFFLDDEGPVIELKDGIETINLNDHYRASHDGYREEDLVEVGRHTFTISHMRLFSGDERTHTLHFGAHSRTVKSERIDKFIPNLKGRLKEDRQEDSFVWTTIVRGDYLDQSVDNERGGFRIPDRDDSEENLLIPQEERDPSMDSIRREVLRTIEGRVAQFIEPIREKKFEAIKRYIFEKAPLYRPIFKHHRAELDAILPDATEEEIDAALRHIYFKVESELRAKIKKIRAVERPEDVSAFQAEYQKTVDEVNELGKANLAQHVVYRRAILDLLKASLEKDEQGKYKYEERVHNIIFPLRTTSDDVLYEQQNLWVIDERLAYHAYLASDKEMKSMEAISSESESRPDIVIFDKPYAFSAEREMPYPAIVLVEFKRPGRDDYTAEKNPVVQCYEYADKIRQGGAKNEAGRILRVTENTRFYAYVVCDLTQTFRRVARILRLTPMADDMGYFAFHEDLRLSVEVVDYDKIVADAVKRNRMFFDKLNLPTD
ncbi:hypothetical protein BE21_56605 [Sorangium cellulosum]|uniref:ATP-binding protein n=1 Tax=Sorangium cellulosum TaxID=56 RepID=A0A150T9M8_SORCE|nr:hypothetical protein BE21_56605 [Sorangium cellulosum]